MSMDDSHTLAEECESSSMRTASTAREGGGEHGEKVATAAAAAAVAATDDNQQGGRGKKLFAIGKNKQSIDNHHTNEAIGNGDGTAFSNLEKQPTALSGGVTADPADEDPYPDGGVRAWLVVLGSWANTCVSFGFISSYGVFQEYYQTHQLADQPASSIAWIGSLQLFLIMFAGIFTGYLFDAGYCRSILLVGSVLLLTGIFVTPECTELWQYILGQGICAGMGAGFVFVPGAAAISHWFKKRRSLAYGIIATGSSTGGVIFPILISRLSAQIGFRWAVRCAGFVALALLAIVNACVRSRLPPRKGKLLDLKHLKDPILDLFILAAALISLGLYTPIFFISGYAQSKGVDEQLAFYLISMLNGASLFGRFVPNLFADKIGPSNILWPASGVAGILCFIWLAASSTPGIIVFACFYGFFSGSYVATIPAVIANISPNMNEIGMRSSLSFAMISFASLGGTPISGALHGDGGWTKPACFSGSVVVLGVAIGLLSRHMAAKKYGTWRI